MLLAANRMPLLLFLFGYVLIILLIKNLRLVMSLSLLIFLLISFPLVKNDINLNKAYNSFFNQINIFRIIEQETKKMDISDKTTESTSLLRVNVSRKKDFLRLSGHGNIYKTSIEMWKERPLFGFGLKSFRIKCFGILDRTGDPNRACANHSHNYYIELLAEAGIVGTSLMILFFIVLLKDSFNYLKKYYQQKNSGMNLLIPVIILFFLEIWPIKSTGSVFTTWGATFFWLNTAMLISATTKKSL